jgi:hypothetical protein
MNIMLDSSAPIFGRILRAVFDAPPEAFAERPVDPAILASAPGLYECTPGTLTNFRPATRIGRLHIAAEGDALVLRSRWGAWKGGVRMLPADPADPAFFAIQTEGSDPAYLALTRDASGRVDGLRCDELTYMVRRDDPAG